MSRSFKKTPICEYATCKSNSNKKSKRIANKKFRMIETSMMNSGKFAELPYKIKKIWSNWNFCKEGKQYFGNMKYDKNEEMRKYYRKLLRK